MSVILQCCECFGNQLCCGLLGLCRGFSKRTIIGIESLDADIFEKLYNAAQSHLSNLTTVSTLLLGFILTGTMLGAVFTGEESFNASALFQFVESAGTAAMLSCGTLIIALLVSVRGSQGYTRVSAKYGYYILKHSALWTLVAEILIYGSFWFFVQSLEDYMAMQYEGPDICPLKTYKGVQQIREDALCAKKGVEWFEAAEDLCGESGRLLAAGQAASGQPGVSGAPNPASSSPPGPAPAASPSGPAPAASPPAPAASASPPTPAPANSTAATPGPGRRSAPPNADTAGGQWLSPANAKEEGQANLCVAYNAMLDYGDQYEYWFAYSVGYYTENMTNNLGEQTRFRMQLASALADQTCGIDKIEANYNVLCKGLAQKPPNDPQRGMCADAYTAYQKADECTDNVKDDAELCYKVCSRADAYSQNPSTQLHALIQDGVAPVQWLFVIIAILRIVTTLVEMCTGVQEEADEDAELAETGPSNGVSPRDYASITPQAMGQMGQDRIDFQRIPNQAFYN